MKHGVKYFSGMTNSRLVLLGGRVFTSDPDQPWVEAVVHATRDSAWASFRNDEVGMIRKGLRADLIVLDRGAID